MKLVVEETAREDNTLDARKDAFATSVQKMLQSFDHINEILTSSLAKLTDTPNAISQKLKQIHQQNTCIRERLSGTLRSALAGETEECKAMVSLIKDLLGLNSSLILLNSNSSTWAPPRPPPINSPSPAYPPSSPKPGLHTRVANQASSHSRRVSAPPPTTHVRENSRDGPQPSHQNFLVLSHSAIPSPRESSISPAPPAAVTSSAPLTTPVAQTGSGQFAGAVVHHKIERPHRRQQAIDLFSGVDSASAQQSNINKFSGTMRGKKRVALLLDASCQDFGVDECGERFTAPDPPKMIDLSDIYQNEFYPYEHLVFLCTDAKRDSSSVAVVCILEKPVPQYPDVSLFLKSDGHQAVVIDKTGAYLIYIDSNLLVKKEKDDLGKECERYLNEQATPGHSYYLVSEPAIPNAILSIEESHPREILHFKVAVLYCSSPTQTVQEMFANVIPRESKFYNFMDSIAERVHLANWSGYRGDFGTDGEDANRETYFQVWREIEIMFHCAPMLIPEQHRRLIGNDIVVIIFYEQLGNQCLPFNPSVMTALGTVPQVFAVVEPQDQAYRMAYFRKPSIKEFLPRSPPSDYRMSPTDIKEYLFIKLHNAMHMVKQCPPMNRLYQVPRLAALEELAQRFPKTNKRFVRVVNRDVLTVEVIQGRFTTRDPSIQSDIFCKLQVGNQKYKTPVSRKTLNPVWNSKFIFNLSGVHAMTNLELKCCDGTDFGSIKLILSEVKTKKEDTCWYPLSLVPMAANLNGEIQLFLSYR